MVCLDSGTPYAEAFGGGGATALTTRPGLTVALAFLGGDAATPGEERLEDACSDPG